MLLDVQQHNSMDINVTISTFCASSFICIWYDKNWHE